MNNHLPMLFGNIVPPMTTTSAPSIFKYMIGDKFIDDKFGDTIEITGFNYVSRTYQGNIYMKLGKRTKTIHNNLIFESKLDRMTLFVPSTTQVYKQDKSVNYRIYFFEGGSGSRSIQRDVQLSNIRALARLLNSIVKNNPKRRVIMVAMLDDNGMYIGQVKLLKKEITEQKFLTGMKERLLAYAKYECGYEVETNF